MRYAVLDLETGGFNRDKCCVMEVGVIALDEQLRTLGEYTQPVNVRNEPGDAFEEGAIKLHRKTGLFEACMSAPDEIKAVDLGASAFLNGLGYKRVELSSQADCMIIGRNPEFDHAFVKRCMPDLNGFFHYRTIDVSTLVQVAALASGLMPDRLKAALATNVPLATQHRAIDDCRLALEQFRYLAASYDGANLLARLRADGKIG